MSTRVIRAAAPTVAPATKATGATATTAAAGTLTLTVPTTAAGDWLYAYVTQAAASVPAAPAGWVLCRSSIANAPGLGVYARKSTGAGEPASYGWVVAAASAGVMIDCSSVCVPTANGAIASNAGLASLPAPNFSTFGINNLVSEAWSCQANAAALTITANVNNPTTRATVSGAAQPGLLVVDFVVGGAVALTGDTAGNGVIATKNECSSDNGS